MLETFEPTAYTVPPALDAALATLWSEDHFAVDGSDLAFLNMCVAAARPDQIVEVGTATGLSTAALACMMGHHGISGPVRSYDLRDVLWFDPDRAVGDLVPQIAGPEAGRVHLRSGVTTLAVAEDVAPDSVGLAFVDASHQHPWPLLDTLLLLPLMTPRALLVHHDLQLYRHAGNPVGVGPKMLFDQLAPAHRAVASDLGLGTAQTKTPSRAVADNVFVMWRRENLARQGRALSQGLLLPWSLVAPLEDALADAITARLRAQYPAEVARNFEIGQDRFRAAHDRYAPPKRGWRGRLGLRR